MRLHRLAVEHVRGLARAEVRFADTGVTVIEAPNETGKTTLFDALDIVLTEKSGARKQQVRELQPEGRDVGSTITAELSLGPHRLTVTKVYNRGHATELTIDGPSRRSLTGDGAHDELRRLLGEHTDLALLEALRFRQGRSLDSVALSGSAALARALDAGAGGTGAGGDDALYDRIVEESARYFTDRAARPTKLLTDADDEVTEQDAEVSRLRDLEAELSRASERAAAVGDEQVAVRERLATAEQELAERSDAAREVAELRGRLENAEQALTNARERHTRASEALRGRQELAEELVDARAEAERTAEAWADADAAIAPLESQEEAAEQALVSAREAAAEAQRSHDRARLIADLAQAQADLVRVRRRQELVEEAVAAARAAEDALDRSRYTPARHQRVREAVAELVRADAQLGAAAPVVRVTANEALRLTADAAGDAAGDAAEELGPGEVWSRGVPERLGFAIGDLARIEVEAGSSLAERQESRRLAAEELTAACGELGIDEADEVELLAEQDRAHREAIDARDRVLHRELDGASREELAEEIRRHEAAVTRLVARRDEASGSVDGDGEQPRLALVDAPEPAELDRLATAARTAREEAGRLESQRERRAAELRRRRESLVEARTARDVAAAAVTRIEQQLARARDANPDEQLAATLASAAEELEVAERQYAAQRERLQDLGADEVETLVGAAQSRVDAAKASLERLHTEEVSLQAQIEVRGGEGLGEALQEATAELERRERSRDALRRRALAARALRDAFEVAREQAYAGYRAPLRERIVAAGRLVFGDDLDVELDEELRVVTRTLGGRTLAFDQLSAGAREQLAILTALAAADLAGEDGVPLVLDDTLGYADPARLERLGAVLGRVRGPQVVVLTCVGARFEAIGGATVVPLRSAADADDPADA